MAEDQGVNGDLWTEQASSLLKKLGWDKVADSNIDIQGVDGLIHGIDALFKYNDGYRNSSEGVFLEAKRYSTSSFREKKVHDWILKLAAKITELRRSQWFNSTYPDMSFTNPKNGLLMLWFHDHDNYRAFRPKLQEALKTAKVPKGKSLPVRLFVLSNDHILRLASLVDSITKWNLEAHQKSSSDLSFYYPSSMGLGSSTNETSALSIELMFSKFIIAKSISVSDTRSRTTYVVYYFGDLTHLGFLSLRNALLVLNIISDAGSNIQIYCYQRNDDFRKIRPDVETFFKASFATAANIEFHAMEQLADLPSWMG